MTVFPIFSKRGLTGYAYYVNLRFCIGLFSVPAPPLRIGERRGFFLPITKSRQIRSFDIIPSPPPSCGAYPWPVQAPRKTSRTLLEARFGGSIIINPPRDGPFGVHFRRIAYPRS